MYDEIYTDLKNHRKKLSAKKEIWKTENIERIDAVIPHLQKICLATFFFRKSLARNCVTIQYKK